METKRTRNYATVVYPESAPEDWEEKLVQQFVPAFISPLHDKDLNPTGDTKKPHYHVIIMFDSVKTVDQALEVFNIIGGVGCEVVKSIRGYSRYLCHLDNPEKAQYNIDDVRQLCGADYNDVIALACDRRASISEMMDFCDTYNVNSLYLLMNYARQFRPDWHKFLVDNAAVTMSLYLKSRKWSVDSGELSIVDPETGEVIGSDIT